MTDEQRNDFDNLILLCPNHHRLVDHLRPFDYPVDVLRKMKADHEARAAPASAWGATPADLSRFAQLLMVALASDDPPAPDAANIGR